MDVFMVIVFMTLSQAGGTPSSGIHISVGETADLTCHLLVDNDTETHSWKYCPYAPASDCSATSWKPLVTVWPEGNSEHLSPGFKARLTLGRGFNLQIDNVNISDSGLYRCEKTTVNPEREVFDNVTRLNVTDTDAVVPAQPDNRLWWLIILLLPVSISLIVLWKYQTGTRGEPSSTTDGPAGITGDGSGMNDTVITLEDPASPLLDTQTPTAEKGTAAEDNASQKCINKTNQLLEKVTTNMRNGTFFKRVTDRLEVDDTTSRTLRLRILKHFWSNWNHDDQSSDNDGQFIERYVDVLTFREYFLKNDSPTKAFSYYATTFVEMVKLLDSGLARDLQVGMLTGMSPVECNDEFRDNPFEFPAQQISDMDEDRSRIVHHAVLYAFASLLVAEFQPLKAHRQTEWEGRCYAIIQQTLRSPRTPQRNSATPQSTAVDASADELSLSREEEIAYLIIDNICAFNAPERKVVECQLRILMEVIYANSAQSTCPESEVDQEVPSQTSNTCGSPMISEVILEYPISCSQPT